MSKPLLILGAGASVPYGYPTGAELVDQIVSSSRVRETLISRFHTEKTDAFLQGLRRSREESIDAYLAVRSHFRSIGKLAISVVIFEGENKENGLYPANGDWYRRIAVHMVKEFQKHGEWPFDVLTFNYDLSCDATLLGVLESNGVEKFSWPILHVHGQLGELRGVSHSPLLRYETPWFRDYDEDPLKSMPMMRMVGLERISSAYLRVVGESCSDDQVARIREIVRNAGKICFLGFGFHQPNVELLGGTDALLRKFVLATRFKCEGAPFDKWKQLYGNVVKFLPENIDCLGFTKDYFDHWVDGSLKEKIARKEQIARAKNFRPSKFVTDW